MKRESWETNRDVSLRPRRGLNYCYGCDANHVYGHEKCQICGRRGEKKRFKKKDLGLRE